LGDGLSGIDLMPRSPSPFRQTDIVRAIRAARAAGEKHFRVKAGDLEVIVGEADAPPTAADDPFTQWERQYEQDKAARTRKRHETTG
jgi:hypothetical protein